ncbi:MAG: hypothetical protein PHR77_00165 [Kiritimatiellae bacterium]|nr:hypothetical protein [Kiritimatiellia bacterium]MDD5519215.1 hypothetical protein [Kiritimatiellia bacterium]
MKTLIVSMIIFAAYTGLSADNFRDDPAKYWNAKELVAPPKYKPAGFSDSESEGLEAIMFEGMPVNGVKMPVFAYIGYPEGEVPKGGFPAIVQVHGGGGTAYPKYVKLWNRHGYAVISLDWYNQRPTFKNTGSELKLTQVPLEGGKRQEHVPNVGNIVLAHSLLRSLPKVNPDKTGFIGISWGSIYGSMVTAVDDRFKFMLQVYCGGVNRTNSTFINGRFLHAAKSPLYWLSNTNDQNITPEALQAAFDEAPTFVNEAMVIRLPHAHIGYEFTASFRIADAVLKGTPPLPKLGRSTIKDSVISAELLEKGKGIKRCVLCYTLDFDVTPWHKRAWKSLPAEVNGNIVSAKLPDGVCQCFLSAYDEEDKWNSCCGSSNLQTFNKK